MRDQTATAKQLPSSISLRVAAHAHLSTTAIEAPGEAISYAHLDARVAALAGALVEAGVTPGATVAVCLPRSIAQLTALLAAWRVSACYLPLDPAWPALNWASFAASASRQPLSRSGASQTSAPSHGLSGAAITRSWT